MFYKRRRKKYICSIIFLSFKFVNGKFEKIINQIIKELDEYILHLCIVKYHEMSIFTCFIKSLKFSIVSRTYEFFTIVKSNSFFSFIFHQQRKTYPNYFVRGIIFRRIRSQIKSIKYVKLKFIYIFIK